MNTELAQQIARAIGARPFDHQSYDAKYDAQRSLSGKTHYADDDALKYFNARINRSGNAAGGLLFWIIESVAQDPDNQSRTNRFVVFDLFGTVVNDREHLDAGYSSTDRAKRACQEWIESFDVAAHYKAALVDRAERAKRDAADLAKAARAIRLPRKVESAQ